MISFGMVRRRIIQLRFFISRANSWANTPMMIMIMLGVLNPYIKQYFNVNFFVMFVVVGTILMIVGYTDYKLGFSKEDYSWGQEQNSLLNEKHELLNDKLDNILAKLEEKKNEEKDTAD